MREEFCIYKGLGFWRAGGRGWYPMWNNQSRMFKMSLYHKTLADKKTRKQKELDVKCTK